MDTPPLDPWKALGVERTADEAEIRTAYKKLVLKCHPDKIADPKLKEQKQDEFQKVQRAYWILNDDGEREKFKHMERRAKAKAASMGIPSPRPQDYPADEVDLDSAYGREREGRRDRERERDREWERDRSRERYDEQERDRERQEFLRFALQLFDEVSPAFYHSPSILTPYRSRPVVGLSPWWLIRSGLDRDIPPETTQPQTTYQNPP